MAEHIEILEEDPLIRELADFTLELVLPLVQRREDCFHIALVKFKLHDHSFLVLI